MELASRKRGCLILAVTAFILLLAWIAPQVTGDRLPRRSVTSAEVSIVTLNVAQNKLLEGTNAARLGHLMNALQQKGADIYLLQECYLACRGVIQMVPGYHAYLAPSGETPQPEETAGGLMSMLTYFGQAARDYVTDYYWHGAGQVILTKNDSVTVEAEEFIPYEVNSLAYVSVQGIQLEQVKLRNGRRLLIANNHFDPRYAEYRAQQATQLLRNLESRRSKDLSVIVGGDFNEDPFDRSGSFGILLSGDGGATAFVPAYSRSQPPTWDVARNPLATDDWQWSHIDNLLISSESQGRLLSSALVFNRNDYPYGQESMSGPLSDHYGVEALYAFP